MLPQGDLCKGPVNVPYRAAVQHLAQVALCCPEVQDRAQTLKPQISLNVTGSQQTRFYSSRCYYLSCSASEDALSYLLPFRLFKLSDRGPMPFSHQSLKLRNRRCSHDALVTLFVFVELLTPTARDSCDRVPSPAGALRPASPAPAAPIGRSGMCLHECASESVSTNNLETELLPSLSFLSSARIRAIFTSPARPFTVATQHRPSSLTPSSPCPQCLGAWL